MKTLFDNTELLFKNSPEFLDSLKEVYINKLTDQGCKFLGYGAMSNNDGSNLPPISETLDGVHILIFELPEDKNAGSLTIDHYEDEGTSGTHFQYFNSLYIIIPMPF